MKNTSEKSGSEQKTLIGIEIFQSFDMLNLRGKSMRYILFAISCGVVIGVTLWTNDMLAFTDWKLKGGRGEPPKQESLLGQIFPSMKKEDPNALNPDHFNTLVEAKKKELEAAGEKSN